MNFFHFVEEIRVFENLGCILPLLEFSWLIQKYRQQLSEVEISGVGSGHVPDFSHLHEKMPLFVAFPH